MSSLLTTLTMLSACSWAAMARARLARWPVTISYFDDKEKQDGLPIYRINFKLYRNGITRDLTMDYGDFSMRGKLVKLDVYDDKAPKADCK